MRTIVPSTPEDLRRTAGAIHVLLRGLLREEDADDVLQDTWVRALERPPGAPGSRTGWLKVVARNLALQRLRTDARRRKRERSLARPGLTDGELDARTRLALHRRLIDAVNALAPPLREAIVGRYFEGVSARRLARRVGVSRATIDRRLVRARQQLRDRLAPASTRGSRNWNAAWIALASGRVQDGAATSASVLGGIAVMTKSVIIALASAAVGFTAGWLVRPDAGPRDLPPESPAAERAVEPAPDDPRLVGLARPDRPSGAAEDTPETTPPPLSTEEAWLRRINEAPSKEELATVIRHFGGLEDAETIRILRAIYARIEDPDDRHQILDWFCHPGMRFVHHYVPAFLDLAARDPSPKVQGRAFSFIDSYWCGELAESQERFEAWSEQYRDASLEELLRANVALFMERVQTLEGEELVEFLDEYGGLEVERGRRDGIDVVAAARAAGAFDLAHQWWANPANDEKLRVEALGILARLKPDRTYLEAHVIPAVAAPDSMSAEMYGSVLRVLANNGGEWALDGILDAYETVPEKGHWWELSHAVARIGKARAIPTLIAVIEADNSYKSVYGIGYFGLGKLTGVNYDESHDGAWWRQWWEENRRRYAPEVAALEIPVLRPRAASTGD